MRIAPLAVLLALVPAAPAVADSPAALDRAVDAVGGEEALEDLRTFSYDASGEVFVFNEGFDPGGPPGRAATFTQTVRHRVRGPQAVRLDLQRASLGAPRPVTEVVEGRRGTITGRYANFGAPLDGATMTSDRWAAIRREQELLNPHLLLRSALGDRDAEGDGANAVVLDDDVAPIRLEVDRATGDLTRLTTKEHDYMRRDVAVEVLYADWQDAGEGVRFPATVTVNVDGFTMHRESRTGLNANPAIDAAVFDTGDAAQPFDAALADRGERTSRFLQSFAALGFPKDGDYSTINPRVLAPGIVLLDGVSNFSLVVERASGVVVVEGSVHDLRAERVIDYVEQAFPGKPITHIVGLHHHVDHNGGMRPYVGLGAAAVVHEAAAGFFADVFGDRSSTILPDRLDESDEPAEILAVPSGGRLELPDAERPVTVYPEPSTHSADTTLVHVPDAGLVFVNGDTYGPGNPPGAGGRALNDLIVRLGLNVEQIAGAHGRPVTYAEFLAALGG